MLLELPDVCFNDMQKNSLTRMIETLKRSHYTDIEIKDRRNGQTHHFEADWIKHLRIKDGQTEKAS